MLLIQHIKQFKDLYLYFLVWAAVGAFLPRFVAAGVVILSYILVLRTRDLSKIFIAFVAILILSDSRAHVFDFAAQAKIGFVVLLFGYIIFNYRNLRSVDTKIFRIFLPFLLFAILASFWSSSLFIALQKSISYALIYFLVPIGYSSAAAEDERFPLDFLCFLTVCLGIGLVIHVFNPAFTTLGGRYRGILGNPNGLGIFLTVVFPLFFLITSKVKSTTAAWRFDYIFYLFFLASLLLTGSRTALFAFLILVFFLRVRYLSNTVSIILFVGLVLGYEYFLQQLPLLISTLGLEEYLRADTLNEGSGRFVAWAFAWEKINNVFFVGGGFGYTESLYQIFKDELSLLGHQGNAHNSYLTLWLDTGLLGVLLYLTGMLRLVMLSSSKTLIALPLIYSVLFSTNFESWLSASLNPFTSLFIIMFTILVSWQSLPNDADELLTEKI
ncbi:MAG: O-antigen ligase family protein [Cryomorphaceae bacterium]